jgi:phosphoglycolate phosphatase-like HAD superfamily hydrolase
MLSQMGVGGMVALLACGDDELPPKPDPAGLRWIAAELETTPGRLAVVGDSANDMLYARNAGAAAIGLLGGAGARERLEKLADAIVESIEALHVVI